MQSSVMECSCRQPPLLLRTSYAGELQCDKGQQEQYKQGCVLQSKHNSSRFGLLGASGVPLVGAAVNCLALAVSSYGWDTVLRFLFLGHCDHRDMFTRWGTWTGHAAKIMTLLPAHVCA